jgi:hypothetical protein
MANQTSPANQAPLTVEALMADRKAFWTTFTGAATIATAVVIAIVVGMAIFLV